MADNANPQQGPDPVWVVDFMKLEADIGDKKKVVIIGPRHADLTRVLQVRLELFRCRRDWVGLRYIGCTQNHQREADAFIEKHQTLFRRAGANQPMALFIDQGLASPMEDLRRLLDSEAQLFFAFIFTADNTLDKYRELGELKDRGFDVIHLSCVRAVQCAEGQPRQINCVRQQQQEERALPEGVPRCARDGELAC